MMYIWHWYLLHFKESSIQVIVVYITNIGNINSIIPIILIQLWSVKAEIVMEPPRILEKEDINYHHKQWELVQNIYIIHFKLYGKRKCLLLNNLVKYRVAKKQNFQVGDAVLLHDGPVRTKWSMAKVLKSYYPNKNGFQRRVGLVIDKSSCKERKLS